MPLSSPDLNRAAKWADYAFLCALLGMVVVLWLGRSDNAPVHDAIQAIGAARSLLAGEGYSSPIVYYELQYRLGPDVPVPQTVFPPGTAALVALLAQVGIPAASAPFVIASAGLLASAAVMRQILLAAGAPSALAALVAVAWLVHPRMGELVRGGAVEPLFIALLLAALWGVQRGLSSRPVWGALLAAGLACAGAVVVRYIGVVPVAALGVTGFLLLRRVGWKPAFAAAVCVGGPAALVAMGLFLRNLALTGRLSGGQFDPARVTDIDAALALLVDAARLSAAMPDWPGLSLAVMVAGGVAGVAAVLWAWRGAERIPPDTQAVLWSCVALVASQALFFAWSTARVAPWFASWRYLLPVVPFVWIILVLLLVSWQGGSRMQRLAVWSSPVLLCAAVFITVRALAAPTPMAQARQEIEQALAAPCGSVTLADHLRALPPHQPVLSTEEHLLHLTTARPVIGLTSSVYTARRFTPEGVRALMERFGARDVVVFSATMARRKAEFAEQPFQSALAAREWPHGFEPVCEGPLASVLRLSPSP